MALAVKSGGGMNRFKENDIITFKDENRNLIKHRIIDVTKGEDQTLYQTKGDNNNAADLEPVLANNVVGVYTGKTIPYMGYFFDFVHSKNGAFLLLIPGFLLLVYSSFTIWRALGNLKVIEKKIGSGLKGSLNK